MHKKYKESVASNWFYISHFSLKIVKMTITYCIDKDIYLKII